MWPRGCAYLSLYQENIRGDHKKNAPRRRKKRRGLCESPPPFSLYLQSLVLLLPESTFLPAEGSCFSHSDPVKKPLFQRDLPLSLNIPWRRQTSSNLVLASKETLCTRSTLWFGLFPAGDSIDPLSLISTRRERFFLNNFCAVFYKLRFPANCSLFHCELKHLLKIIMRFSRFYRES
jgi:hypothetical protein